MNRVVGLLYEIAYRVGFKPWDTGVPPTELVALVEGQDGLRPGRAVDLGCGTGTNVVYLSRHGWEVTGVDMVGHALTVARRRAAAAVLRATFDERVATFVMDAFGAVNRHTTLSAVEFATAS